MPFVNRAQDIIAKKMGGVQEEWNVDTGEMECEHGRMERYLPVQKSTGIMDRSGAQRFLIRK